MFNLSHATRTASSFIRDESGNFALMFAAASTAIMLSAGIAVDVSRMVSAKTQLRAALDSALLSTAKDMAKGKITKGQAEAKANELFLANLSAVRFPAGTAQMTDFTFNAKDLTITANANSTVERLFPLVGDKTAKVQTKSGAGFVERKVEVSMVLDVTGSMADFNKINDLKTAAKAGVTEFLSNNAGNTRVAIVPYSFGVNAGGLSKYVVDTKGKPGKDACSTERRGSDMFTDASPITSKVTRADKINYAEPGKKHVAYDMFCPDTAVQPLTKNAATLNKVINDLSPIGGTAGQIGVQWGWYMLSPEWQTALKGASEPEAYNEPNVDKFLILMTDGMFNSEATGLATSDVASFDGISQLSGRLAMTYCEAIKDKNVKIFTIGFRLKDIPGKAERDEATRMLTDCASTPTANQPTFYNAENGAELTAAFKEIARKVETVRLTN